ncbi:hypothetical protein, partial [uncultured Arthrobacter sp.]|uniref:hypothetical protein n=1 Tax=uncultured Arthrobacter sp. TaxID=114050 RepID=UPI003216E059
LASYFSRSTVKYPHGFRDGLKAVVTSHTSKNPLNEQQRGNLRAPGHGIELAAMAHECTTGLPPAGPQNRPLKT